MEWFTEFPSLSRGELGAFRKIIDAGFREFTQHYGDSLERFFDPLLGFLVWSEKLLLTTPWPIMIALIAGLAWSGSRSVKIVFGVELQFKRRFAESL